MLLEYASTGRAGCKGSLCKKTAVKILKGELRCGSYYIFDGDKGAWAWKHWYHIPSLDLSNRFDTLTGDA